MSNSRRLGVLLISGFLTILFVTISGSGFSQVKYHSDDFTISIKGTSSIHDWEMISEKGQLDAVFVIGNSGRVTGLSGLQFTVLSRSLKSGHNLMDSKTYKALKTNTHSNISFNLISVRIVEVDANNYQLKCQGNLTIAGVTHETELVTGCKLNADKTFTCSGSKKLKMTDFNITPPIALMGTIKTGDEISVAYSMNISK